MDDTTTPDLLVIGYAVIADGDAFEFDLEIDARAFALAFDGVVFPVVNFGALEVD